MAWDWDKTRPERPIKKNEAARYQGVLVPEENYRIYRNIVAIDEAIEEQDLKKNQLLCDEKAYNAYLYIFVGLALGFAGSMVIFSH